MTPYYTSNFTVNAGPVAQGGVVAGLVDVEGGMAQVVGGKLNLIVSATPDAQKARLIVQGSEIDQESVVRLSGGIVSDFAFVLGNREFTYYKKAATAPDDWLGRGYMLYVGRLAANGAVPHIYLYRRHIDGRNYRLNSDPADNTFLNTGDLIDGTWWNAALEYEWVVTSATVGDGTTDLDLSVYPSPGGVRGARVFHVVLNDGFAEMQSIALGSNFPGGPGVAAIYGGFGYQVGENPLPVNYTLPINALKFSEQSGTPTLVVDDPTISAQDDTTVTLVSHPSGGVGALITDRWDKAKDTWLLTQGVGTFIAGAVNSPNTLDISDLLPGDIEAFTYHAHDSNGTPQSAYSRAVLVEKTRAARPGFTQIKFQYAGGAILLFVGDSNVVSGDTLTRTKNELLIDTPLVDAQIILANCAETARSGSKRIRDFSQGSAEYNVTTYDIAHGFPDGTGNIWTHIFREADRITALHPGLPLIMLFGQACTNDSIDGNALNVNASSAVLMEYRVECAARGYRFFVVDAPFLQPGPLPDAFRNIHFAYRARDRADAAANSATLRDLNDGFMFADYLGYKIAQNLLHILNDAVHVNTAGSTLRAQMLAHALWDNEIGEAATDTTPPAITGATLAAGGLILTLTTSETTTGTLGFTFTVNGGLRAAIVTRTDQAHLQALLSSVAYQGEVIRYSYDPATGNILDTAGNELGVIVNGVVVNSSTQVPGGGGGGATTLAYLLPVGNWPQPDTVFLTEDDSAGGLEYVLRDASGNPIPIADSAVIRFRMKKRAASLATINAFASVAYGPGGVVRFLWTVGVPVPAAGQYDMTFQVDGVTLPPLRIPVLIEAALV